jgi:hypothetical protein
MESAAFPMESIADRSPTLVGIVTGSVTAICCSGRRPDGQPR